MIYVEKLFNLHLYYHLFAVLIYGQLTTCTMNTINMKREDFIKILFGWGLEAQLYSLSQALLGPMD
jgi:hypothetical protein